MTRKITKAGKFSQILSALTAVVVLTFGVTKAEAAPGIELSPEWQAAVEPLQSMPVQDYGFIRSGYTFADNHLMAITGKKSLDGIPATDVVLGILAKPEEAREFPLIKISHPELAQIVGDKRISLAQYRDPALQQKLMNLYRADVEKWNKPIGEIEHKAQLIEGLENDFAIVPREGEWKSPKAPGGELLPGDAPIIEQWNILKTALREDNAAQGAQAAGALSAAVSAATEMRNLELPKLNLDVFYHEHNPFAKAAVFYLFAAIVYSAAWLIGRPKLHWIGFALLSLGLVEHSVGVGVRWILSGRAPLSNMFESFTFAIGGMVLVGIGFEAFNRTRIVGMGSAILGFIFMVLAHKAPIFDSQIRPLMPALQSSWLTYHVVVIMLSYSAFALSFFVSVLYLMKDVLFKGDATRNPLIRRLPSLAAMDVFNYRIIGIGFPLLTIGIIFGAIWAATAWGRPWGFDPKETWSAITWLIYAIYLHTRFLAGWKGRRTAILALIGFAAVMFTYLGVNYLLPGLHSYV